MDSFAVGASDRGAVGVVLFSLAGVTRFGADVADALEAEAAIAQFGCGVAFLADFLHALRSAAVRGIGAKEPLEAFVASRGLTVFVVVGFVAGLHTYAFEADQAIEAVFGATCEVACFADTLGSGQHWLEAEGSGVACDGLSANLAFVALGCVLAFFNADTGAIVAAEEADVARSTVDLLVGVAWVAGFVAEGACLDGNISSGEFQAFQSHADLGAVGVGLARVQACT